MSREELLNSADYWQEIAENQCWREGIKCNIHLIDNNNQWNKAIDKLPSKPHEDSIFSNKVLMTDGEEAYVGFYSYESKTWYNSTNNSIQHRITHWKEIPQLP